MVNYYGIEVPDEICRLILRRLGYTLPVKGLPFGEIILWLYGSRALCFDERVEFISG